MRGLDQKKREKTDLEDFSQPGGPDLTTGHYVFTNGSKPGCTLVSPGKLFKNANS